MNFNCRPAESQIRVTGMVELFVGGDIVASTVPEQKNFNRFLRPGPRKGA
jgi:hypothetical protein